MFVDVNKAHLSRRVDVGEFAYVEAPTGSGSTEKCWKFKRWLCGMRPVASVWEAGYSEQLNTWA